MKYSSIEDTLKHKQTVTKYLNIIIKELIKRSEEHDNSKMEIGEVEYFDIYTPKLKDVTYGSPEYNEMLKELKPALDHHYANNKHHPDHFANGISDMDLIDLIEMVCDWKASSQRMSDGNILTSIQKNQSRFGYDEQLNSIFINTVKRFE